MSVRSRPQWTEERYTLAIAAIDEKLAKMPMGASREEIELRCTKEVLLHDRQLLMRRADRRMALP